MERILTKKYKRVSVEPKIPSHIKALKGFIKSYSNKYFSVESKNELKICTVNIRIKATKNLPISLNSNKKNSDIITIIRHTPIINNEKN